MPCDRGSPRRFALGLILVAMLPVAAAVVVQKVLTDRGRAEPESVAWARAMGEALLREDGGRVSVLLSRFHLLHTHDDLHTHEDRPDGYRVRGLAEAEEWVRRERNQGRRPVLGKVLKIERPVDPETGVEDPDGVQAVFFEVVAATDRQVLMIDLGLLQNPDPEDDVERAVSFWDWAAYADLIRWSDRMRATQGLSLRRARISANEASAMASLRTLAASEEQYKAAEGKGVYASLARLNIATPPYIDSVLSGGVKSGYSFTGAVDGGRNFTFHAVPLRPGRTGNRRFFVDGSGVIRMNSSGAATTGSAPIE